MKDEHEPQQDKRQTFQRKLSRMVSSLSGNDHPTSKPAQQLTLYIKIGYYDHNVIRNALSIIVVGSKRWVTERVEVWEEVDQRAYVRSLARALAQQAGAEGVLRKDDSGDRLNTEVSLQKNGVCDAATLRFDMSFRRGRTNDAPVSPRKAEAEAHATGGARISV